MPNVLSVNAQQPTHRVASRDITQAFAQAGTKLVRQICANAPSFLNLGNEVSLMFQYLLYGLVESGVHWLLRYNDHHKSRLHLRPSAFDFCLLHLHIYFCDTQHLGPSLNPSSTGKSFTFNEKRLDVPCHASPKGIVAIQVEDVLFGDSDEFLDLEEREVQVFDHKPRAVVDKSTSI